MTPQELRASIIQQAIQGKLVEQRPEEGTAEELFQQIQEEKAAWIIAGKMKRDKVQQEITTEEIPFDIPDTWKWVRIQDLFNVKSAMRIHQTDWKTSGIPFFRGRELVQLVKTGNVNFDIYISRELYEANKAKGGVPQKDDLLISAVGTLGKVYVVKGTREFYYKDAYILCLENIGKMFPHYVKFALESPYSQAEIRRDSMATTVAQLTIIKAKGLLIPLPPVEEQKRIVAKLEEILPLIDRYETAWNKLEEFNKRFPGDMQKSILQLAIQGKLVEQRPEEGTAVALKAALIKKKQEWVSAGAILKKADTKAFYGDEDLFDIPDTWEWVQLSDVSIIQEGAGIRKWQYRNDGTQILCVTNILDGSVDLDKKRLYISTEEYLEKYTHLTLKKGDIVTSCSGGSWGKIAFFDSDETLMLNTSTLRMRFFDDLADNNYLYYVCKSPFFKRQLELQLSGMQPNFGYAHYSRIVFPLPPLAEQKRIVAKLEEILPLCDRLK